MDEQQYDDILNLNSETNLEHTYLTFGIDNEEYAVNISYVTEIVGMQKISEVPEVPHFIKGVVNLRGKVIPIMDMRLRFNLPEQAYHDRTTIIVLELNNISTGLVVDRVSDVITILPADIDPTPRWHNTTETGIIMGVGKRANTVSLIINAQRLLSVESLA